MARVASELRLEVSKLALRLERLPVPRPSEDDTLRFLDLDLDVHEMAIDQCLSIMRAGRYPSVEFERVRLSRQYLRKRLRRLMREGRSSHRRAGAAQRLKYLERLDGVAFDARQVAEQFWNRGLA